MRHTVIICFLIFVALSAPSSASISKTIIHFVTEDVSRIISFLNGFIDLSVPVNYLAKTILAAFRIPHYYDNIKPKQNSTYDFIIVGAGTAGSVLANRLSEISNWNILVLESGKEAPGIVEVPLALLLLQYTQLDYSFYAEYDNRSCRACTGGRMHIPRGKALGGSSEINYMFHTRGNKGDFDKWAKMGNNGWNWDDVLPYYIKLEDASRVSIQDSGYHGTKGYVNISDVPFRTRIAEAFVNASRDAGYKYVDYNGAQQLGVSWVQGALRNGARCSQEKAYLRPARIRPNLDIVFDAKVTKILIDDQRNRTTGVTFTKGGVKYTINAKKEVILSAGTILSPQLLMLSGVGPKDNLEQFNITVKKELPVGQTMYDHLLFTGLVFTVDEDQGLNRSLFATPKTYTNYLFHGRGPVTTTAAGEAFLYLNTNTTGTPAEYPDTEVVISAGTLGLDLGLAYRKTYSISRETYKKYWKPLEFKSGFQLAPISLHPKSVGHIRLQSANIDDPPLLYMNYFANESDVKTFVAAIRESIRVTQQPSFQKYKPTLVEAPLPGCEDYTFNSDEYWSCAAHGYATTSHHQISTCKMGLENDTTAVVNNRLRVHGFSNLRVVDASIIPSPMAAHTNAPTIMIAEKAADMIKEDWLATTTENY